MSDHRFDRAYFFYNSGQYDASIDLLKEILGEEPNDAVSHGLLASCLLNQKRLHAAEYEIGIALGLEPQLPFLLLVKGNISQFKNQPSQALEYCDEALAIDPEFVEALLFKADIYGLMDKSSERLSCIERALVLEPDSAGVVTSLGAYYYSVGQLDKAKAIVTDALMLSAQNEQSNLLMGKVQLELDDIDDAEYHAKFVIMSNPNSDEALTLLSGIKARKNWFLGLWWKMNSKLNKLDNLKASMFLVFGYLFFTLLSQVLDDFGYSTAASVTNYAWLLLALYSWVGIPLYQKGLQKELEKFQFNKDY